MAAAVAASVDPGRWESTDANTDELRGGDGGPLVARLGEEPHLRAFQFAGDSGNHPSNKKKNPWTSLVTMIRSDWIGGALTACSATRSTICSAMISCSK